MPWAGMMARLWRSKLVGVAGVAVIVAGCGHFADGDYAAVSDFAAFAFELDGGVVDVEAVFGERIDFEQDAIAFGGWDVIDLYVAGEGVGLRTEAPDVQVVDVDDAFDGLHTGADFVEGEAARGAFQEDVEGFADDVGGAPEDHGGDEDGEDGIDPVLACPENACASGDDCGG